MIFASKVNQPDVRIPIAFMSLKNFLVGLLVVLSGVVSGGLSAGPAEVEKAIEKMAPGLEEYAIAESLMPGLYEVQVGSEIVYFDETGQFMMQGRLIDVDTRQDLTEASRAKSRIELMQSMDNASSIEFAPAQPVHEVLVFTDIDCGYCRKLHAEREQFNEQGIALRYMFFPRAGLESESFSKAVSVWCAEDRHAALTAAKAGQEIEPLQCDNPIANQYQQGMEMGVTTTGTPSLYTSDGVSIPGYVPPEQLRERLDALAATSTSTVASGQ